MTAVVSGLAPHARRRSGPRGNLVTGSLKQYRTDLLGFLERCAKDYGDFVPVRVAFRRGCLIGSSDLIGDVLVRQHRDFRKVFPLRMNRCFLGEGMLTSEGEQWRRDRRLAQPAFHAERIAGYGQVITDEAMRTAAEWRAAGPGAVRDVQQEMMHLALRAIVRCMFDTAAPLDSARISHSLDVVQRRMEDRYRALVPLPDSAWTPRNVPLRLALRELDQTVYGIIDERRDSGVDGPDLLSMLMQARYEDDTGLTDGQLRDQITTILFAGHETTALALAWSWHLLAQNPHVDSWLQSELDMALGGRTPTVADVPRLGAVTQIVKEAMRLYPPVYAFGRDAIRDTEIGGRAVNAGTSMIISPWVIHRDPRIFADPLAFQPARWTPQFERSLPKFGYVPFGGGARMCMGKGFAMIEAVLILATLRQTHRLEAIPGHAVELWPTFTLRSRNGLPMRLLRAD
ncbi:MAG: Unspecific monooxygenase [Frankiales bacterium]|nr:Unspecific monooxygenase [Frankiales bacterium]